MEADDLPCSRNARSRTPLVGRAQWKITQPPSLKIERARLEESFSIDDGRSTRAGQDHLTYAFTTLLDQPLHPQEHMQPEGFRIIGFHVVISARMVRCG